MGGREGRDQGMKNSPYQGSRKKKHRKEFEVRELKRKEKALKETKEDEQISK